MKEVSLLDLGLIDYKDAWNLQEELFDQTIQIKIGKRKGDIPASTPTQNHLILCEHPHVYTLGKTGDETNLLLNKETLASSNATFYKINRGGDITYHGPGQIVGYPVLDLDHFFTDIGRFLRYLEEAVILTLREYGIKAGRIKGSTGVWLEPDKSQNARKICAIGVRTSRWVTMHGFALNVNTDLNYFTNIVPCGITDKAVTSMEKELGETIDPAKVRAILCKHFASLFECTFIPALNPNPIKEQSL